MLVTLVTGEALGQAELCTMGLTLTEFLSSAIGASLSLNHRFVNIPHMKRLSNVPKSTVHAAINHATCV